MRIFVDTNIVSELLEERSLVDYIDLIFEKAEQKGWTRVLSVGSFYTITFLTERFLRHQGIGQPQLVEKQRIILNSLLQAFEIVDDTIGIFWVEKENNSINKKLEALCTLFRVDANVHFLIKWNQGSNQRISCVRWI